MDFYIPSYYSLGSCFFLSCLYVSSLYVWSSDENRDHPTTIKKRFFSVFVVMLISPLFIYFFSSENVLKNFSLWEVLGLRLDGFIQALVFPLLLTMVLFLGPLSVQISTSVWRFCTRQRETTPTSQDTDDSEAKLKFLTPNYWFKTYCQDLLWMRNHVVAPLSEEFTFRACMMPLLLQTFSPTASIFITPLFFGVAHLHHMYERLRVGMEWKTTILISLFQFFYTSVFGIYSAYLFVRSGHFIAPFIVHAFCNHMGFPDIPDLVTQREPKRCIFVIFYVLGMIGWIFLLPMLTKPELYHNQQFWINTTNVSKIY